MSAPDDFAAELLSEAAAAQQQLLDEYQRLGETALGRVKGRTPVRTGALRDSWRLEGSPAGFGDVEIVSDLPYAEEVEDDHAMVALTFAELELEAGGD